MEQEFVKISQIIFVVEIEVKILVDISACLGLLLILRIIPQN